MSECNKSMITNWEEVVNRITDTTEEWKADKRNWLIVVDNKDDKYHASAGGSWNEVARMIATLMLRREPFAEAVIKAVKLFKSQRNSLGGYRQA